MPKGIYRRHLNQGFQKGKSGYWSGKNLSQETKRKISEAKKGKSSGMKGKKHTGEAKQKNREKHIGISHKHSEKTKLKIKQNHSHYWRGKHNLKNSGEKSPNWKGGITPENIKIRKSIESHLWREAVFARDNWTCQKYGIRGGILHSHHINNFAEFPELRFAIDNGITLSEQAHIKFHKIYGKKNNTKGQLEEFLNL